MDQEKLDKLKDHLENAEDWAKLEASPGVYVVKIPGKGKFKSLSVEISPKKEDGKAFKRKGLYLSNMGQLQAFIDIFSDEGLIDTMKGIVETNESIKSAPKEKRDNVVGKL